LERINVESDKTKINKANHTYGYMYKIADTPNYHSAVNPFRKKQDMM
jgi:hypothetical protein